LVTISPLIRPMKAPTASTSRIATGIGRPAWTIRPVTSTPSMLAAKPMERSSSPTMTAMVSPPAMIAAREAWFSTLRPLPTLGKASGDSPEKMPIISSRPTIVP
jgi:hypothetical protein